MGTTTKINIKVQANHHGKPASIKTMRLILVSRIAQNYKNISE